MFRHNNVITDTKQLITAKLASGTFSNLTQITDMPARNHVLAKYEL